MNGVICNEGRNRIEMISTLLSDVYACNANISPAHILRSLNDLLYIHPYNECNQLIGHQPYPTK